METGGTNEPDREQLEFVTRSYAGFQALGLAWLEYSWPYMERLTCYGVRLFP